jgi:hypothetical protein
LSIECNIPIRDARRRLRIGHAMANMPVAAAAIAAGEIDPAHVEVLSRARTGVEDLFARAEEDLVGTAHKVTFAGFSRAVRYWRDLADPDGAADRDNARAERRRVHLSKTLDDTWALDGLLDPIAGTIVADELARIEQRLFITEWNDAKRRLGRDPTVADMARTPAQRRADALVEMATRSATAPKHGKRPEPLFTVVIGSARFERLVELHNRTVVNETTLLPYIDTARIQRVVFDPKSRRVDLGAKRRLFSDAERELLKTLYPECAHDLCEEPAYRCQMDHIEPFTDGGPTLLANGRSMCPFHNRRRNTHPDDDSCRRDE